MYANNYMPGGKLGAHRHGGKVFQVQTEFAQRPRPRLSSSVVVDGRTVHKIDRDWPHDLSREENQLRLDIELEEQHKATMALVVDRATEFLSTGDLAKDGYAQPTFRDAMEEVLRGCPYIMALYEFDQKGDVIYRNMFRDVVAEWDREFAALSAIIFGLPEIIRVGDLRHGTAQFGTENLIVARIRSRAFGILTEERATIEQLETDFPEFFEATTDAGSPV